MEYCLALHLAFFGRCLEHVSDIWLLLYLLLITLNCVIVLTFILIVLCTRPKTVYSLMTQQVLFWFSVGLKNLGNYYVKVNNTPKFLALQAAHLTGTTAVLCCCTLQFLIVFCFVLIPFVTIYNNVRLSPSDLLLDIGNMNLV